MLRVVVITGKNPSERRSGSGRDAEDLIGDSFVTSLAPEAAR